MCALSTQAKAKRQRKRISADDVRQTQENVLGTLGFDQLDGCSKSPKFIH